jgi:hypothetical protein
VFCAGDGGALGQSGQSRFRDVFRLRGKYGKCWMGGALDRGVSPGFCEIQSFRRAVAGSMVAARAEGIRLASSAITIKAPADSAMVEGSWPVRP